MSDPTIAVATTGPVPDNQCALKDAILLASVSDSQMGPEEVVAAAKLFFAFLQAPTDTPAPPAIAH